MNFGVKCRFCDAPLEHTFVDLGLSPLANSYVKESDALKMEPFFPLHTYVCGKCFLVQLPEFQSPENIFSDYAYFSSYSDSWLRHAQEYTKMMVERFNFNGQSHVVEIASNDGYLLQYFKEKDIPVLGIEPAANVAAVAIDKGIPTEVCFFGEDTAQKLKQHHKSADLVLGNNVLAHVPDLNNFVKGLKTLLKSDGIITMEFPHLMNLIRGNQFDTIYHEHFSYFSFSTVREVFQFHGLNIFDVEELPTHGGSLRIFACHKENNEYQTGARAKELLEREEEMGFYNLEYYARFSEQVKETKRKVLEFLINEKRKGKAIVGYGAPAKGNTLLNYCGIRTDFLDYTVDRSPHKQIAFSQE